MAVDDLDPQAGLVDFKPKLATMRQRLLGDEAQAPPGNIRWPDGEQTVTGQGHNTPNGAPGYPEPAGFYSF